MRFELFLKELAKVWQFSSLAPDEKGACLISLKEEDLFLLFEYDDQLVPNTVLLSTEIIPFPIVYRSDMYEVCLKGNHSIEETLSVKPDEDLLYLHRRFHPDIDAEDLDPLITSFIHCVKEWRENVARLISKPPRTFQIPSFPTSIRFFHP